MTKFIKTFGFLLVALMLALPVFAQRKVTPKTAPTPIAKEKLQRQADENSVRNMKDPGFDMAVVVKNTIIREMPAATGKVLLNVKRGDFLSLVVKEADKNWYNVVEAESGTEGWINGNDVVIKLTTNTITGPPLREENAAANALPEISISNLEEKTTLRIRLNGKLYMIKPGATEVVQMPAGKFTYYGWSPGIRPATGSRIIEKGRKYIWEFKIVTR